AVITGIILFLGGTTALLLVESRRGLRSPPIFHSTAPDHSVRVPFRLDNGLMIVRAELGGRPFDCALDTGAAAPLWPGWIGIPARPGHAGGSVSDGGGTVVQYSMRVLSRLRLGGYEVRNLPGWAIAADTLRTTDAPGTRMPLLGNSTFAGTVLTIDYRSRCLTIRPPGAPLRARPGTNAQLLDFLPPEDTEHPGEELRPVVSAEIAGIRAPVNLDSGWLCLDVGLAPGLFARVRKASEKPGNALGKRVRKLFAFAPAMVTPVGQTAVRLGDAHPLKFRIRGFETGGGLETSHRAVLGAPVFRNFRVTIDYERRKVLLEPYPRNWLVLPRKPGPRTPGTVLTMTGVGRPRVILLPEETEIERTPAGNLVIDGVEVTFSEMLRHADSARKHTASSAP
ncbi:MAG TPA: retropepsin-like aspartic protease, partial [Armatimonadota bacterium]|nr:retropepsin-like aspartic protease [Armatimonadota bacterium]